MWTLNSVRIFVQESTGEASQIIPRLQPLNAGTVLQFFGYDEYRRSLNAIVVGDDDRDALKSLVYSGSTPVSLVTPEGTEGNFFVNKIAYKQIPNVCQTLRTDLPEDVPVYIFDMELYPDI